MTGAHPPGRIRSLGASLLDDVLAETLDPAYAEAAARRAGGEPPRRGRGRVLVALTMAAAGLLAAVTYDQAAARAEGRQEIREALVSDIQDESARSDELAARLEELRAEVSRTSDELLAATAVGQRALDALARAEQGTAAVAVTGPGLLVTLANAEADADDDPIGTGAPSDAVQVADGDLQLVVNALWGAGAEAISINGQRLGPTSAIRFAGEAVLVNFRPVTSPYRISAVGDPDALSQNFLLDPQVRDLAEFAAATGLQFVFAEEEDLSLPAANPPELRSAEVVSPRRVPGTEPGPGG
ncbi:Uncharacterized conserved protein YlxW, UPF0749 family [Blastococcus sp. DSM 46786]|uniref:DUF881 domain-containing protein n=1 Tax=Blastococcus sp. DSM 46786 TaxID=1798227 RepID=UPI0008C24A81|nr:DUF881 domain-containing protein [Blastococcus sp. DSM 46786]SEL69978.1 Uncharacterized conserved protein YlxW, UPF0749 family [Blastococcus sp. DSM 46786]